MALPSGDSVNLRGILVDGGKRILSMRIDASPTATANFNGSDELTAYCRSRCICSAGCYSESSLSALQGRSLHGAFGLLKCKTSP
jgi:hypothetical protein